MTKEQLLKAGYTEAQVENILKLHKEAIDGNYIPKHRFDEVSGELKNVREQLGERDKQIDGLKKFEGTAAELEEKIKELERDNANKDSEYKNSLALERKTNLVKLALLSDENGKPHDVEMTLKLFDLSKINVDEATGSISSGYKEQRDALAKEKSFLFSQKEPKNFGWRFAGKEPADGKTGEDGKRKDESTEYGKLLAQSRLAQMGIKQVETKTN